MRSLLAYLLLLFLFFSCKQQEEKKNLSSHSPLVEDTNGDIVHTDLMGKSNVVFFDSSKIKKIAVTIPGILPLNNNIYPVGKPTIIKAGNPKITFPGQNPYEKPNFIAAHDSSYIAGTPYVVEAKAPNTKDQNSQNFSSYSKLQGLKQQNIYCMLEDKLGNLWFGTNGGGVSKFDGKSFSHYTTKEGLASNVVRCMMEDKKGNLWFGFFNGGFCRYDGTSFTRFSAKEGFFNNDIFCMLEDKNGIIWLGTNGGGVCRFDGKNFSNYTEKEGLSNNFVLSILQDKSGKLWFGTNGGGVCRFDGKLFAN
ncbi:MAG: two-component regulator propeller domain-containing protein, partial [Bacteroidota bacterium]